MRLLPFRVLVASCYLLSAELGAALKIAANLNWIEHTPLLYTINNSYSAGPDRPIMMDGGVITLSDTSDIIIGANSETQGLKQYFLHKNYRLIYVLVEVTYRLVANKIEGVQTLADLKGKKIGTFNGTSAEVFVRALMDNAGLNPDVGDYTLVNTLVNGSMCMRAPCGPGTLPAMLKQREIDAFGCWETAPELAIQDLGEDNVRVFQNATLFREIFSLYATAEALSDTKQRAQIVRYIKSVNKTLELFKTPEKVLPFVSRTINVPETVIGNVWENHVWGPGSLGKELIDFLEMEETYLGRMDNRTAMSRADLENFVDASVYEDALEL
ncbi:putative aliphatic sulfonates-binding protein [Podospora aff. communis PSN243]|uniref:Aliphatic sulfonates-binding protein n=1 Tax=Podospora aff. communis PSN243 TaxID=3040156 RepID=A0AAV9GP60_9PEZI|nr:putative aliphatic sulfonates-binding protein [Podospora aff. communis PSN243]